MDILRCVQWHDENAQGRGNKEVNGGRTIEINSQFIGHLLTDKKDEFV